MRAVDKHWLPITGYEELYEISSHGEVRSLHKRNLGNILKVWDNNRGYLFCSLYKNGNTTNQDIHRIVAEHFIMRPNCNLVVNHIDGNKHNNNVINLEWITQKENVNHAVGLGRIKKGVECKSAKLTEKDVIHIRELYSTGKYEQKEIGRIFSVDSSVICRIVNKKLWKHV
jgi:hypothetical protein